jgi:hypothetical protein
MVELVKPLQHRALDDDADRTDQDRRDDQRRPVAESGILQDQIGGERTQHVLRAVREIDDVEHAENDGETETEQRVERTIDQPEQQLPEQRLRWNAEDFEHDFPLIPPPQGEGGSSRSKEPGGDRSNPTRRSLSLASPSPLCGEG